MTSVRRQIHNFMESNPDSDRLQALKVKNSEDMTKFNAAIQAGAKPILKTAFGDYVVKYVDDAWWYHTYPVNGSPNDPFSARSFAGCNDYAWADLLKQVGVV
jgi:hypothetical protein